METISPPVLGAELGEQVSGECARAEGTPESGGCGCLLPYAGQVMAAEAAGTIEAFDVSPPSRHSQYLSPPLCSGVAVIGKVVHESPPCLPQAK